MESLVHVVPVRDEGGKTRHLVLYRDRYGPQSGRVGRRAADATFSFSTCFTSLSTSRVNLLGARYGDSSGTTGIPFFGHIFPIGPVSGSSNFGHFVQIAVCVLYVGSSLLVCHKSDHDDDVLWKNQP